jgi:hypothetical protein
MFCKCDVAVGLVVSIAVVGLALFPDFTLAQKADKPDVKVGDRWQFVVYYTVPSTTPNRAWLITSVNPKAIEGRENGELLRMTPELNVLESPRNKDSNPRLLSFPLEVGKRWNYTTDWEFKPKGSNGSAAVDVAVVAYEKIKVPAGEFDAFKLTATENLSGTSPINSQYAGSIGRIYWYAPEARSIVKSVYHNPYLGPSTVELVEFELKR